MLVQIGAWITIGMPDFYLGVAVTGVQVALIAIFLNLIVVER